MEDDHLQRRLDAARRSVTEQRQWLRAALRRRREVEAAASERSDRATERLLRARGHPSPDPPVPSHPPDWLEQGLPEQDLDGQSPPGQRPPDRSPRGETS